MIDKDNFELEDFKYEFDLRYFMKLPFIDGMVNLLTGYLHLHQFTKQDLFELTDDELINEFKNSLEENETFTNDNKFFKFKLNFITDEIIEYIRFRLKYCLILYKEFIVDYKNNEISFIRIYGN